MSLPRRHGRPSESDHRIATMQTFRIPIGFLSACIFCVTPNLWYRIGGLLLGICMLVLPDKIVDAIGYWIYGGAFVAFVLFMLTK